MNNTQTILNNSPLLSDEIMACQVNSPITSASTEVNLSTDEPDLNEAATFKRLLDCLSYALAIDDTVNLAAALGMAESLSNQEVLYVWVKNETHNIQFLDASALFNFLVRQLDNLIFTVRKAQ